MWRARFFFDIQCLQFFAVYIEPVCVMCNITFIDPIRFPIVSILTLCFFIPFLFSPVLASSISLYLSSLLCFVSLSVKSFFLSFSFRLSVFLNSHCSFSQLELHSSFPSIVVSLNSTKLPSKSHRITPQKQCTSE